MVHGGRHSHQGWCMGDGIVIKDGAWAHIEGADLEVNQGGVGVHVMGYGSSVSLSSSLLVSKAGHVGLLVKGGGHAEIKDSTIDCRHNPVVEISSQVAANWGVLGNHSKARSPPLVVTGTRSMLLLGEEVEVYGMGIDLKESLLVCERGQVQGQLIEVPVFAPSQEFEPH
ncbi:hypothetical protein CEUSTIGMA_g5863.t1 [Chlamydomonas eustigma]|uniref:Right handed beta helix domain-containing protein n=1 Tax=Chlamydomonas eustigma TaxID=1157962 RepID=A0A250X5R4_9CHLO|nr:hypothetical protein CEUSTIGMA_g5863.t1 [Chlamydomonas eustigma]|eukprot:GAX78421.1 hypothetical protein CEUSTIGMA_g5863.t1 [Chlamydomonas eustigma]